MADAEKDKLSEALSAMAGGQTSDPGESSEKAPPAPAAPKLKAPAPAPSSRGHVPSRSAALPGGFASPAAPKARPLAPASSSRPKLTVPLAPPPVEVPPPAEVPPSAEVPPPDELTVLDDVSPPDDETLSEEVILPDEQVAEPPPSPTTTPIRAHAAKPRPMVKKRKTPIGQRIETKRTLIPVLLTMGVFLPGLLGTAYLADPESMLGKLTEIGIGYKALLVIMGLILLGFAVANMMQVKAMLDAREAAKRAAEEEASNSPPPASV